MEPQGTREIGSVYQETKLLALHECETNQPWRWCSFKWHFCLSDFRLSRFHCNLNWTFGGGIQERVHYIPLSVMAAHMPISPVIGRASLCRWYSSAVTDLFCFVLFTPCTICIWNTHYALSLQCVVCSRCVAIYKCAVVPEFHVGTWVVPLLQTLANV